MIDVENKTNERESEKEKKNNDQKIIREALEDFLKKEKEKKRQYFERKTEREIKISRQKKKRI